MRFVIDASVAVEYLLRTRLGRQLGQTIAEADLFAPELLDAEVFAVVRRCVRRKGLAATRAVEALSDLGAWDLERLPLRTLFSGAWPVRDNVSAYDAFYVAAATAADATLLTADGPLARAPNLPVVVHNVRAP